MAATAVSYFTMPPFIENAWNTPIQSRKTDPLPQERKYGRYTGRLLLKLSMHHAEHLTTHVQCAVCSVGQQLHVWALPLKIMYTEYRQYAPDACMQPGSNKCTGVSQLKNNLFWACGQHIHGKKPSKKPQWGKKELQWWTIHMRRWWKSHQSGTGDEYWVISTV